MEIQMIFFAKVCINKLGSFFLQKSRVNKNILQKDMSNQVAEYTHRLSTFRKEIRKHEIEQIFTNQRRKIQLIYQQRHLSEVSSQLTNLYEDLIEALQQQGYEDFINYKRTHFSVDWLYQFTSRNVSYQLQFMSTSILAQYYYISDLKMPSQLNLNCLLDCFSQSQNEILKNCVFILDNILDSYREIKQILIQKFNIVELIIQKIEKCRNQRNLLHKILKIVYRLLNYSKYYNAYSQLIHPLANFILSLQDQSTPFTDKINITAIYNFHMLFKMFPQINDLSKQIVQANIITKLVRLLGKPEYAYNRLIFLVLDLIQICRQSLKQEYIQCLIMDLIMDLRNMRFQFGRKSSIFTTQAVKTKAYNYLLYLAQNNSQITQKVFFQNNYLTLRSFLQQLSFQQSPIIAQMLTKIVYCLSFWLREDNQLIQLIRYQIKKTLSLNQYRDLQQYLAQDIANTKQL